MACLDGQQASCYTLLVGLQWYACCLILPIYCTIFRCTCGIGVRIMGNVNHAKPIHELDKDITLTC